MYNYTTNVLVTVSTSLMIFEVRSVEAHLLNYIFTLVNPNRTGERMPPQVFLTEMEETALLE